MVTLDWKKEKCFVIKMFLQTTWKSLIKLKGLQLAIDGNNAAILSVWIGLLTAFYLNGVSAFYVESNADAEIVPDSLLQGQGYIDDVRDDNLLQSGFHEGTASSDFGRSSKSDTYPDVMKRYLRPNRGWGHRSRYPWTRLPDRNCFQRKCKRDKDCCMKHNICDRSARICRDCWYGSSCKRESDCCHEYPHCLRRWLPDYTRKGKYISTGKCVDSHYKLSRFGR